MSSDSNDQANGDGPQSGSAKASRSRKQRPFPADTFENSLTLASAIFEYGSGQPVRRVSLFDHLGKSPESGASRQAITNAGKYGLIKGSYKADLLELTPDGQRVVDDEISKRERTRAQVKLAIEDIPVFNDLFQRFVGNKLPARAALVDAATTPETEGEYVEELVDTFIVNLRFVGLLQTLSGAERIVSVDHLLDGLPTSTGRSKVHLERQPEGQTQSLVTSEDADFQTTCFYITPIGDEDSEERRHSDLILGSIIEPALEQFKLKVVRADKIGKTGLITRQIIDYLVKARLVIADLSFSNPNVFYELAIRHAVRLPFVQIIRARDKIPFDVGQIRTISIDTTDIYTLVPRIEIYKSEISTHVRKALDESDQIENPISIFYPHLRVHTEG